MSTERTMAMCKYCGDQISWARRSSGRMIPLSSRGWVDVIDSKGVLRSTISYARHTCSESERLAWQQRQEERAATTQSYFEERDAAWEVALARTCPKCEAGEGEHCFNLSKLRWHDERVSTAWPHGERLPERRGIDPLEDDDE